HRLQYLSVFYYFNDPTTTDIYTLSLHDALPISGIELNEPDGQQVADLSRTRLGSAIGTPAYMSPEQAAGRNAELDGRSDQYAMADRKSTRLNSSHVEISYAVFCLKKKNKKIKSK